MSTTPEPKNGNRITWQTFLPLVGIAIPVMALDWVSKWLVKTHITRAIEVIPIIPGFFNLRHDRNSGAAFGVLSGHRYLLIVITLLALAIIFSYYFRFRESRWMRVALGFLLGGAMGNFIDRLYLGEVIDFLQFGIVAKGWYWPTFNVADISVCVGAGMLVVYLFQHRHDPS